MNHTNRYPNNNQYYSQHPQHIHAYGQYYPPNASASHHYSHYNNPGQQHYQNNGYYEQRPTSQWSSGHASVGGRNFPRVDQTRHSMEPGGYQQVPTWHHQQPMPHGVPPTVQLPNPHLLHKNTNRQRAKAGGNEVYECVPCGKKFQKLCEQVNHMKSHIKCTECNFSASKRVLKDHVSKEHRENLGNEEKYKILNVGGKEYRVLLGTAPEDIETWRAERRKKWPTSQQVEEKNALKKHLEDAGAIPEVVVAATPTKSREPKRKRKAADVVEHSNAKVPKTGSLLKKLLKSEQRTENNKILQVFRRLVRNNFII